jgi:glycosyltransferase involved in cell wall biosynthesis
MAAFYTKILSFTHNFIFIHNSHNTFYNKKILTKFALKNAHILAVGNKVKDNLCDFYRIPKLHVTVIHNSVESFEGFIQPLGILQKYKNQGYFLVGNIGRLSEQKGMQYFIKAVPLVLKECEKTKFFIIGDGEEKEKIERLIHELHLENDIILLGYRNDVQNVMSQLDLIVLSSLWEGFPLTPIEAFSVGKTIVATSIEGTDEIINDGVNGILVETKKSNQIANAIINIIQNPKKRRILEKSAYDTYMLEFSYEDFKKKYLNYYKCFND